MGTVATRPGEIFIHSFLWECCSSGLKPSVTHKYPYSKHQPLLCQHLSSSDTRVVFTCSYLPFFDVPAIPFSYLPFHPRVAHQTSPAWVCADRKPTDRLPGHSERSWASFTRPLEETVSQQIHSGGWAPQSAPLMGQGSNKGGFAAVSCWVS